MNDEPISTKSKSHSLEFFLFVDTVNKNVLQSIVAESLSFSLSLSTAIPFAHFSGNPEWT